MTIPAPYNPAPKPWTCERCNQQFPADEIWEFLVHETFVERVCKPCKETCQERLRKLREGK